MSDAASYEAIVIGGGPAGLTAGMYLARAGRKTLLLERTILGGQIAQTSHLENYPGFPEPLTGRELADRLEKQAVRFGLEIQFGRVEALRLDEGWKEVVASGFPFRAPVVVVATGLVQSLGIPGEEEFLGRGVSYCATCDGALYRQRSVAVVGASEWAMEEAHYLTQFVSTLYLVVPVGGVKPTTPLRRDVLAHPSVRIVAGAHPLEIAGDASGVTGLLAEIHGSGEPARLDVEGVFIFSGKRRPGTEFLRGLVDLDDDGYARANDACETSVPGVYAVGDVRRHRFHQVAAAVGDGCIAGMDALRHLKRGHSG